MRKLRSVLSNRLVTKISMGEPNLDQYKANTRQFKPILFRGQSIDSLLNRLPKVQTERLGTNQLIMPKGTLPMTSRTGLLSTRERASDKAQEAPLSSRQLGISNQISAPVATTQGDTQPKNNDDE